MIKDDRTVDVALRRRMRALGQIGVRVGVFQGGKVRDRKGRFQGGDSGSATIADVAAAHEFGTRTVPQRSFIARTIDGRAAEIDRLQDAVIGRVIAGEDPRDAAELVGLGVASMVRDTIRSNVPPPLSPATVERKGDSRTLVDTGQLLNAVKHEVGRDDADA